MAENDFERVDGALRDLGVDTTGLRQEILAKVDSGEPELFFTYQHRFNEDMVIYRLRAVWEDQQYSVESFEAFLPLLPITHQVIGPVDTLALELQLEQLNWPALRINDTSIAERNIDQESSVASDLSRLRDSDDPAAEMIYAQLTLKFLMGTEWEDMEAVDQFHGVTHRSHFYDLHDEDRNIAQAYQLLKADAYGVCRDLRRIGLTVSRQELEDKMLTGTSGFLLHACNFYGDDRADFITGVRRDEQTGAYGFEGYSVNILRDLNVPDTTIGGVNSRDLDDRMREINWQDAQSLFTGKREGNGQQLRPEVQAIIQRLREIEKDPQGKEIKDLLAVKYLSVSSWFQLEINYDLVSELMKTASSEKFPNDISFEESYNLLSGRSVYRSEGKEHSGNGYWLSFDLSRRDNSGHYAHIITHNLPNWKLREAVTMLPIASSTIHIADISRHLLSGSRVPVVLHNQRQYHLEADPAADTLRIFDRDMKPVLANIFLDSDWKPQLHQQQPQQQTARRNHKHRP